MGRLTTLIRIAGLILVLSSPTLALDLDARLPDGGTARDRTGDIRAAWYVGPTERYAHAVLGDGIEAAGLMVRDAQGRTHRVILPEVAVFEDITPRLADLDGDGRLEVITIRATSSGGGAIAVYGLVDGVLAERAATPPIGMPNRWLNPAGIADFDGDGTPEIAVVRTPHIGGTLQFWSLDGARMILEAEQFGFSNHAIGSRDLDLSFIADVDGDGTDDLILPDAARFTLQAVALKGGAIETLKDAALPERVDHNLRGSRRATGIAIRVPRSSGSDFIVKFDP